jgi:hypothetical protein
MMLELFVALRVSLSEYGPLMQDHVRLAAHIASLLDAEVIWHVVQKPAAFGRSRSRRGRITGKRESDPETPEDATAHRCCPGAYLVVKLKDQSVSGGGAHLRRALVRRAIQIARRNTNVLYVASLREDAPTYKALVRHRLRCFRCLIYKNGNAGKPRSNLIEYNIPP